MTNADRHMQAMPHAVWRTARKDHRCDGYFFKSCIGSGTIQSGERYLDTGDMRTHTRGPVMFKACKQCALSKAKGEADA